MKKIVVATDFTESSQGALMYASFLAEHFDAQLSLIHVYFPMVSSNMENTLDGITATSLEQEVIENFEYKLKQIALTLEGKNIKTESKLIMGSLAPSISEYASEQGADLIVVGKTPESSFIDRLLGSNASNIVKKTSIPVLVVPASSLTPAFKHIIYGTELEAEEKDVLSQVFEWSRKFKSKVTLIKIEADFEPDIHDDEQFLADIHNTFKEEQFTFESIKADKVSDGLLKAANDYRADVLVLARHHHNFLSELVDPSKSKQIINKTDVPLLVYDIEA